MFCTAPVLSMWVCYRALQCVAVCCSALQCECVAVCCSALQCAAVFGSCTRRSVLHALHSIKDFVFVLLLFTSCLQPSRPCASKHSQKVSYLHFLPSKFASWLLENVMGILFYLVILAANWLLGFFYLEVALVEWHRQHNHEHQLQPFVFYLCRHIWVIYHQRRKCMCCLCEYICAVYRNTCTSHKYICMYIYTYMYIHTHVYTHTYICIYIMYVYIQIHTYVYNTHTHTHTHICRFICYLHTHMHVNIYI